MHFKKTGYLYLLRNRELIFEQINENTTKDTLRQKRNALLDDISVIDGASAILSSGGGKAFSIRSSQLHAKSIITPASNLSAKS